MPSTRSRLWTVGGAAVEVGSGVATGRLDSVLPVLWVTANAAAKAAIASRPATAHLRSVVLIGSLPQSG